jgi:hypothetical protein
VVTTVDANHLNSMFEAMAELEGICARLAALRMTIDERRNLEAEHRASHRLIQDGAEEDYAAYHTRFHTALYLGAHNEHIYDLVTQTWARLAPFRRAQFHLPSRLVRSFEEHDAIVTAIMRADATKPPSLRGTPKKSDPFLSRKQIPYRTREVCRSQVKSKSCPRNQFYLLRDFGIVGRSKRTTLVWSQVMMISPSSNQWSCDTNKDDPEGEPFALSSHWVSPSLVSVCPICSRK